MGAEELWSPRRGAGVCVDCFTFIDAGFSRCLVCARLPHALATIVPIAYSVEGGELHRDIASYKRDADPSVDATSARLAALLDAFLEAHEPCIATAAGIERFGVVTVVPSRLSRAGDRHPLESLLGARVPAVAPRLRHLLDRGRAAVRPRHFDRGRFIATSELHGESVLLIDDMWTSGASAQSAAAALRSAGAESVSALIIGRHLNRRRFDPERMLRLRAARFDLRICVCCAEPQDRP